MSTTVRATNSSTLRVSNLLRVVEVLRRNGELSRQEIGEHVGVALQSSHRLVDELSHLDLVVARVRVPDGSANGRPTTLFKFNAEMGCLIGADVGSETARLSLAYLDGESVEKIEVATSTLAKDLPGGLATLAEELRNRLGAPELVGVTVGVPGVVDSEGRIVSPWQRTEWHGLELQGRLRQMLRAPVSVYQDNHLSPLAETGPRGTVPYCSNALVVEIGIGIGCGLLHDGSTVVGTVGRFGRLMGWPCSPPEGMSFLGNTLGQLLTAPSLLRQYEARSRRPSSTLTPPDVFKQYFAKDPAAVSTIEWGIVCLERTLTRLALLLDPAAIVVGGGLGRQLLALSDRSFLNKLTCPVRVLPTGMNGEAPLAGALREAEGFVIPWVVQRLENGGLG